MSDHCPIAATIEVQTSCQTQSNEYLFIDRPKKIPWDKDIAFRFENLLQTNEFKDKIETLMNESCSNQCEIDRTTASLSTILTDCAVQADITKIKNVKCKGGENEKIIKNRIQGCSNQ